MLVISYWRFRDCISIFLVHLSTDSVIPGAKGGTSIFLDFGISRCSFDRFYANSHNSLIFFDGSLLKLLVLSPALNVSVTTDRH